MKQSHYWAHQFLTIECLESEFPIEAFGNDSVMQGSLRVALSSKMALSSWGREFPLGSFELTMNEIETVR